MNLQHECILALCQELKLERVPEHYPLLAQQAVREQHSFSDFLQHLLEHEQRFRLQRRHEQLTRQAGFPAIKTLEDYDFGFSPGLSKTLVQELAGLAFIERTENWSSSGRPAWARPIWPSPWAIGPRSAASRCASSPLPT